MTENPSTPAQAPEDPFWASRLEGLLRLSRNGSEEVFVPASDYEAVCMREASLRQTLALVSADLFAELPHDHVVLARLRLAGFDEHMAKAVREIAAQFTDPRSPRG